jgi:hypothetical protein
VSLELSYIEMKFNSLILCLTTSSVLSAPVDSSSLDRRGIIDTVSSWFNSENPEEDNQNVENEAWWETWFTSENPEEDNQVTYEDLLEDLLVPTPPSSTPPAGAPITPPGEEVQ